MARYEMSEFEWSVIRSLIHVVTDEHGLFMELSRTPGNTHNIKAAADLLNDIEKVRHADRLTALIGSEILFVNAVHRSEFPQIKSQTARLLLTLFSKGTQLGCLVAVCDGVV